MPVEAAAGPVKYIQELVVALAVEVPVVPSPLIKAEMRPDMVPAVVVALQPYLVSQPKLVEKEVMVLSSSSTINPG
jgi:hypothetical protein